jgi:hypothetical protein
MQLDIAVKINILPLAQLARLIAELKEISKILRTTNTVPGVSF